MIDELEIYNYGIGPIEAAQGGNVMSATVAASPPSVQLGWRIAWVNGQNQQQPKTLTRRPLGGTNWTTLSTNVTGLTVTDTNVTVGSRYEYLLDFHDGLGTQEYILSGINATPIDYRGKLILLVDQTLTNALATNLTQLTQDLVGDGWKVIRHDAHRHDDATWSNNTNNIAVIKGWITNDYNADPTNTKAVYIVGHVSIPFSGWLSPDGHGLRPFPADGYYGSIGETNWTDSLNPCCQTNGFYNIPNDGIFDQSVLPKNQFLGVGRADFANMPAFNSTNVPGVPPKSETDLLEQYLNKNHAFRNKAFQFADRSVAASSYPPGSVGLFASADRTASRLYGFDSSRVDAGDPLAVTKNSHLIGFAAGYGNPNAMNVIGNDHHSADLADPSKEPMVGFYVLSASYFGAWHLQDDFLRATIATPTYGLEAMYAVLQVETQLPLYLEPVGLGEPIAAAVTRTITNQEASVEITLLGDPTLRFQVIAPPSGLAATTNQSSVILNWTSSSEPGAQYFVYRSTNGLDGDFLRLSQAINTISYTDSSPPAGQKMYQVRAARIITAGSGSFTNLSQAVFTTVNQ